MFRQIALCLAIAIACAAAPLSSAFAHGHHHHDRFYVHQRPVFVPYVGRPAVYYPVNHCYSEENWRRYCRYYDPRYGRYSHCRCVW